MNIQNFLNEIRVLSQTNERNIFDISMLLLPRETESGDLLIEMFIDRILDCPTKEEDVLLLLHKHFNGIVNYEL